MATTSTSNAALSEGGSTATRWTESWSPGPTSRVAGVLLLIWLATVFLSFGDQFFSDLSARQVVTWVSQNQKELWIGGFMGGLQNTLMVTVLVLLTYLSMDSRLLGSLARVGAAAAMAAGWIDAGAEYALADLAHRGGAEAGILALFSLTKTMVYTDGLSFELAIGAISVMLLRSHALPRPVAWLGLAYAVVLAVETPIQLAVIGSVNGGPQGPLHVFLTLLWAVVMAITLLVKPVRLDAAPGQPATISQPIGTPAS